MNQAQQAIEDLIDVGFEPPAVEVEEGLNDPYIFKWIAMAGGTGSGKSFVASHMFKGLGLKFVNSDAPLEQMAKKLGIDLRKELGSDIVQQVLRPSAKRLTKSRQSVLMGEKLGVVWDGTGADFDKMKKAKDMAEDAGYDTFMVFVNTDLETALARNQRRDRVVPDEIATKKWQEAQANLSRFRRLFGPRNFVEIVSEDQDPREFQMNIEPQLRRTALKLLSRPIQNKLAIRWIEAKVAERTGQADPRLVQKIVRGR